MTGQIRAWPARPRCKDHFFVFHSGRGYLNANFPQLGMLELDPNRTSFFNQFLAAFIGAIQILGIAACLYFIWTSRHAEKE